ncbi:MAG: periplasmic heavy metal sensor [Enhydrobacter sp.]|nr:MAG: periplasmic heavy metal sensor [Enhydrobacter sp.]
MATMTIRTMLAALLVGSLAATAGGPALARGDKAGADPAKFQQRIEKRVDRALDGTDASEEQKKKVTEILQSAFADMKPLHTKRVEARKAMTDAMQAPAIDRAKIEQIRQEQMKVADEASQRFTKALTDAGSVLNQAQRQAFFKKWSERGEHRGKRG